MWYERFFFFYQVFTNSNLPTSISLLYNNVTGKLYNKIYSYIRVISSIEYPVRIIVFSIFLNSESREHTTFKWRDKIPVNTFATSNYIVIGNDTWEKFHPSQINTKEMSQDIQNFYNCYFSTRKKKKDNEHCKGCHRNQYQIISTFVPSSDLQENIRMLDNFLQRMVNGFRLGMQCYHRVAKYNSLGSKICTLF